MNAKEFLEELFGFKNNDALIQIFQTPSRRTSRFQDIDKAVAFIERMSANTTGDIYFCCGLTKRTDLGTERRGEKPDIAVVPGLWMDIDVADPLHKKTDLPQSKEDVFDLIKTFDLSPTMVVNSGHGIHAYWLFKEPWEFTDDADRAKFETLNFRLQSFLQRAAEKRGWKLDSTYDCTRILRVVGTVNHKDSDHPVPVELIEHLGMRYEPDQLADFLPEVVGVPAATISQEKIDEISSKITIDATLEPPVVKLEMLLEVDSKFRGSWKGQRADWEGKKSPSEFVLSIVNGAVSAGWDDQEIAALVVAWYRRHLTNPFFNTGGNKIDIAKSTNKKYISRTILKAREWYESHNPVQEQPSLSSLPSPKNETAGEAPAASPASSFEKPEETPQFESSETARVQASQTIGYEIISLTKYEQEDAVTYVMKMKDKDAGGTIRELKMKTVDQLTMKPLFDKIFFMAFNHNPPDIKKDIWKKLVQTFQFFMQVERVSDESSTRGRIKAWIRTYLDEAAKLNIDQAILNKDPFLHAKNGDWYIFSMPFRRWTFHNCGCMDGASKLHVDLRLCGILEETVNYVKSSNGAKTSTKAWHVPRSVYDPSGPVKLKTENNLVCLPGGETEDTSFDPVELEKKSMPA